MATTTPEESAPEADEQAKIEAWEVSIFQSGQRGAERILTTHRLFREHGLTIMVENKEGVVEEKFDYDKIRDRVYGAIESENAIVVTQADYDVDKNNLRLFRDTVAGLVLDQYPTEDSDPDAWFALDVDVRDAWKVANSEIWKSISMQPGSALQKRVKGRKDGLMLVKTNKYVYLTAEFKYIQNDVFTPRTDSLEREARRLGAEFGLWANQVPGLQKAANRALNSATKAAQKKAAAAFLDRAESQDDPSENEDQE